MNNVYSLPATDAMTPLQALLSALEFAKNDDLNEVLIIGYDGDGDFMVRSSKMDRRDALWLVERMRLYVMDGCRDRQY